MNTYTFASGTGYFTLTNDTTSEVYYYPKNSYEIHVNGDTITVGVTTEISEIPVFKGKAGNISNAGADLAAKAAAIAAIIFA